MSLAAASCTPVDEPSPSTGGVALEPEPQRREAEPPRSAPRRAPEEQSLLEVLGRALDRNKIPRTELPVYLAYCHVESRFTPDAVSPVGATGLFQLMTGTAAGIARQHPDFRQRALKIHNPIYRNGRPILHRGAAARYSMKALRWYAAHMKLVKRERAAQELRPVATLLPGWPRTSGEILAQLERAELTYHAALGEADQRFDPYTNALLGTYYISHLNRTYFNKYRCYRSRDAKHCGTFRGRNATLLAAACFHLGPGPVMELLAHSRARSIHSYIQHASRSRRRSYRRNGSYLKKLVVVHDKYARLVRGRALSREGVARIFGDDALADRLFAPYRSGQL
jgi:hypothetical protein